MSEFFIPNLTEEEEKILIENDIEWYPDDILLGGRDIVIEGTKGNIDKILKLIGRKYES